MIGHLRGESLQFNHTFGLEVSDRIIERLVLRLRCRPCHENVLEHPQHEVGFGVKSCSGKGDKELKDTFTDKRVLSNRQLLFSLSATNMTVCMTAYLYIHLQQPTTPLLKMCLDARDFLLLKGC